MGSCHFLVIFVLVDWQHCLDWYEFLKNKRRTLVCVITVKINRKTYRNFLFAASPISGSRLPFIFGLLEIYIFPHVVAGNSPLVASKTIQNNSGAFVDFSLDSRWGTHRQFETGRSLVVSSSFNRVSSRSKYLPATYLYVFIRTSSLSCSQNEIRNTRCESRTNVATRVTCRTGLSTLTIRK